MRALQICIVNVESAFFGQAGLKKYNLKDIQGVLEARDQKDTAILLRVKEGNLT